MGWRQPWRLTPPAMLKLCAGVGLFFLGVNLSGLLNWVYEHKSLEVFAEACGRADRGELFLVFCGEKERAMVAWSSRGNHLAEEPHGEKGDPEKNIPSVPLADLLQAKIDGPTRRFVMLPAETLEQFTTEFPTWRRHLFPTQALAINDTWYWLLSNRADLPTTPPPAAVEAGLQPWHTAQDVRLLVHPTQAGFKLRLADHDLPRIWNGADLEAWAQAHPTQALVVPEEAQPGQEPPVLNRIRTEWPLFDRTFREVGVIRLGPDLTATPGVPSIPGLTLHLFVAQPKKAP